jgi:hypothetical protein
MKWQIIVALFVMSPVILLPVLVVWHLRNNNMLSVPIEAEDRSTARE